MKIIANKETFQEELPGLAEYLINALLILGIKLNEYEFASVIGKEKKSVLPTYEVIFDHNTYPCALWILIDRNEDSSFKITQILFNFT